MTDPIVGIDLGTSNTVVAHADASNLAVVLADANGFKIHPSVVSFHPSGGVVVGAAAKQRKVIDPKNTIYSVKRLIGRPFGSREVQEAKRRAPFNIKEGANQLPLIVTRGGEFAVPEISAIVLDHAKNVATSALKIDVSRAVVTVPASFNDAQRSATATAGSIAGLTVVRVLNEPTAAALAYGATRNLEETIAVYDFGGGTFDITILRLQDQVYEVLGTAGDSFLGGDDLDERIVDRMVDKFLAEHRVDLRTNEVSMMRLRAVAEQTKIELSRRSRAVVRVDEIAYGPKGKPLDLQIEIRRDEFVGQVADIIDKTFPVCTEALKLANIGTDRIDDVILVGGTTKIPYVRDQVTTFFGKAPRTDVNPEDAVAVGAALQATALERILTRKSPSRAPVTETSVVEGIPQPIGVTFEDEDEGTFDGPAETQTYDGGLRLDDLGMDTDFEPTRTKPSHAAPPVSAPSPKAQPRATERPVERGKHKDHVFGVPTTPPLPAPPPAGPVIGRLTKQLQPPPATPAKTTTPRVTAQRPPAVPAVPPATPQAKTLMLEPVPTPIASEPSRRIAQQPTVIVAQDSLSPAATSPDLSPAATAQGMGKAGASDDFLDLGDDLGGDFGFPNLTTEKGFADVPLPPSSTARGMPAAPAPASRPSSPPTSTAKGFPAAPAPAPTQAFAAPASASVAGPTPAAVVSPAPVAVPDLYGAAVAAPKKAASPVILDVTPRGLGIGTVAGFCEELIRRNSRLPTEMRKLFTTSRDDQDAVRIIVVQGESRRMQQNTVIADLRLDNLPRRPRGETSIEVTFMLDANGILNVRARDAQTGREQRASLDIIGSIPHEDVSASRERLQALRR